jgi:hypothetical protein
LKSLYRSLCLGSEADRDRAMAQGVAPDPESMMGWEFYGYNTMPLTVALGIRKFKKGFYRRAKGRTPMAGYNVKIRPSVLDGPWDAGGPGGAYVGYFDCTPVTKDKGGLHPGSLLLDYGADSRNMLFDGSFLRDYVVMPDPKEPDVLLGRAYAALAGARVPVSYFVLQRAHAASQPAAFLEAA